ncbi:unnamed protein product [Symbiodinium sp. CCMP2592]|nr:unnamed protein product [Symbiodinium sp. CCMP2592]
MADAVPPIVGVVGVGTIGSAVVRGLCKSGPETPPKGLRAVVLSPRGTAKAEALRSEFPKIVRVASSNREVVEEADCVLVSVLPQQAEMVLQDLAFRPDQEVISLVAGLSVQKLRDLCAPARSVSIAIPFPSVAKQSGAALLLQPGPGARAVFRLVGRHVAVEDSEHFRRLMCVSGLMGNFYKQQLTAQEQRHCVTVLVLEWLEEGGVPADTAAAWTSAAFGAFAADSAGATPHTFAELLAEQTAGGLNEKVWQLMEEDGNNDALRHVLEAVHHRLQHGAFDASLAPKVQRALGVQEQVPASFMALFTAWLSVWRRWRRRRSAL